MAFGGEREVFSAIRTVHISVISTRAHHPEPLSRSEKIKRVDSGFRTTQGNIAAIDFGTTFCTLAYTTTGDAEVNTLKLDGVHQRVPNAVLVEKGERECRVVDFGYRAQETYSKMRSSDRVNHIYFERMKMILERDEDLNRECVVEAFNGDSYYIVEVIAFILKYLKDRLNEHLSKTFNIVRGADFDWVITVPAIWKARGKRMMREAAYMAGLLSPFDGITTFTRVGRGIPRPDEINPDRLSLALEPESAAIYSQSITMKAIHSSDMMYQFRSTKYMVIDIGGGTVDITAHHEDDGNIEVIVTPIGNDCGGTKVNKQFSNLLADIVDDTDFESFLSVADHRKKVNHKANLNRILYNEFEQQKLVFGETVAEEDDLLDASGYDKEICILLPPSFIEHYGDDVIQRGADCIKGVQFDDDTLYISYGKVAELFQPAINGIIQCTLSALKGLEGEVDTIYLVGGFGGCKYVHAEIKSAIETKFPHEGYNVIVPTSPSLAIASGAVLWRKNPAVIRKRRSDATYGIACSIPYEPGKHSQHFCYFHREEQIYRSRDVFVVFLQKGEYANVDEVFTTAVAPERHEQTTMTFKIYSTPKVGIQYVKDEEDKFTVRQIGQLIVDIPNPDNRPKDQRMVDMTMDFSGTEIQAKAKYRVTGEEVKTVCDFLSTQNDD